MAVIDRIGRRFTASVRSLLEGQVATKVNASAAGIAADASNFGAFDGSVINDNETAKAAIQSLETELERKNSALGSALGATHLGALGGAIIPDDGSAKGALQALQSELEKKNTALGSALGASDMGEYTGSILTNNQTAKENIQNLADAVAARVIAAALAETTGAASVGADDGASGAMWSNLGGFLSYLLSSSGANAVGFMQAGSGAVLKSLLDEVRLTVNILQFYDAATHAGDYLPAWNAAIARLKALGGGILWCPYVGGYEFSYTPAINGSNITARIDDPSWSVTATTITTGQPLNAIKVSGTSSSRIVNVGIECKSKTTFDGNGASITGYTYNATAAGSHHAVYVAHAEKVHLKNVYGYNGLIGGIGFLNVYSGVVESCEGSHTVYDNGIYVFPTLDFDANDRSTWANITFINCVGHHCRNHGLGVYGAVGTTWISPRVYSCGNNVPVVGGTGVAGPVGGFGIEKHNTLSIADYHTSIEDIEIDDCYGYSFRTNCDGVRVRGGKITNAKYPDGYDPGDDTEGAWGSSVFVQNVEDVDIEVDILGSEKYGLRLKGTTSESAPAGCRFKGKIDQCAQQAAYGNVISNVFLDLSAGCNDNGDASLTTAGQNYTIEMTNNGSATYAGTGKVTLIGDFDENGSGVFTANNIGKAIVKSSISGSNNGKFWASAYHALYFSNTGIVDAANINLRDDNAKIARIAVINNADDVFIDRSTIAGDQTSTVKDYVEITGTAPTVHRGNPPTRSIYPTFSSSFTPNSTNGNPIIGAMTANMTINADSPSAPPMEGQKIRFYLLQNGTGGYTVTWNAAWIGASLTGSGTADQWAIVEFTYMNSKWVETLNTGWST